MSQMRFLMKFLKNKLRKGDVKFELNEHVANRIIIFFVSSLFKITVPCTCALFVIVATDNRLYSDTDQSQLTNNIYINFWCLFTGVIEITVMYGLGI